MTIQVWYHGACDDGFGAAWSVYRHFEKNKTNEKIVYIPCFYGKPHPVYSQKDIIYIVDFSYPRDVLEKIKYGVAGLTILDHHKTAQADLQDFKGAIFDMNRSGAVITWSYFNPEPVPLLLRYVQDNDLWQHKLKDSREITRYIRTMPHTFQAWDILFAEFETDLGAVGSRARAIEKYFQNQILFNSSVAQIIDFEGMKVPIINCNTTFISEMCHHLLTTHKTEIAMSFFINQHNKVIFSLRSAGKVDVSTIAKKYFGGGHHNAAGFVAQLSVLHALLTQVTE